MRLPARMSASDKRDLLSGDEDAVAKQLSSAFRSPANAGGMGALGSGGQGSVKGAGPGQRVGVLQDQDELKTLFSRARHGRYKVCVCVSVSLSVSVSAPVPVFAIPVAQVVDSCCTSTKADHVCLSKPVSLMCVGACVWERARLLRHASPAPHTQSRRSSLAQACML
jgi:hypothetical protein